MVTSFPLKLFQLINNNYSCLQWIHDYKNQQYEVFITDNAEFSHLIGMKKAIWVKEFRDLGFKNQHKGRTMQDRRVSTLYYHEDFHPLSTDTQLENITKLTTKRIPSNRKCKYNRKHKPVDFTPTSFGPIFNQSLPDFDSPLEIQTPEQEQDTIGFFTDEEAQIARIPRVCSFDQLFIDEYDISDLMNSSLVESVPECV